jgi:hypothetical protein
VICRGGDSEGFGYLEGFMVGSSVSEVQAAFVASLAVPLRGGPNGYVEAERSEVENWCQRSEKQHSYL